MLGHAANAIDGSMMGNLPHAEAGLPILIIAHVIRAGAVILGWLLASYVSKLEQRDDIGLGHSSLTASDCVDGVREVRTRLSKIIPQEVKAVDGKAMGQSPLLANP